MSLTALKLRTNEFSNGKTKVIKVDTKCPLLKGIDCKVTKPHEILHNVLENPMWNKIRRNMFRSTLRLRIERF